jgi:hypothetical protein
MDFLLVHFQQNGMFGAIEMLEGTLVIFGIAAHCSAIETQTQRTALVFLVSRAEVGSFGDVVGHFFEFERQQVFT